MPKGDSRPGAGRKPGAAWNGSGGYERGVRFSCTLRPDLHEWLKARSDECGISMSALVNLGIWRMKERSEGNDS